MKYQERSITDSSGSIRTGALLTVHEVLWCLVGYTDTSLYVSPTRGRLLALDFTGTLNSRMGYVSAPQSARDRITIPGATNRQLTHNMNYASSEQFIAPISTSDLQRVYSLTDQRTGRIFVLGCNTVIGSRSQPLIYKGLSKQTYNLASCICGHPTST